MSNIPEDVVTLRALTAKIATTDHFFGGALAPKAARYENFLRGGLSPDGRSLVTLDRWRWPSTRTSVSNKC